METSYGFVSPDTMNHQLGDKFGGKKRTIKDMHGQDARAFLSNSKRTRRNTQADDQIGHPINQQTDQQRIVNTSAQKFRASGALDLLRLPNEILIKIVDEVILDDSSVRMDASLVMSPQTQQKGDSKSLYETCSFFHTIIPTRFAALNRITASGYMLLFAGPRLFSSAMAQCQFSIIGSISAILKEAKIPEKSSLLDKAVIMELKERLAV